MPPLTFEPIVVPLCEDEHGAIRVGVSRVLLDLVIREFQNGAAPEEIVASYDALTLPDVYAVLSCYLQNPQAIDEYLRRRAQEAETIRQKIESSQPPRPNLRAVLIARAQARKKANASAD